MLVPTNTLLSRLLAAALEPTGDTFEGPLVGVKLGLYTVNVALTGNTVLADLTEPTYTGYARVVITWSAPIFNAPGFWSIFGQLVTFLCTAVASPQQTIYGYSIISIDSTPILLAAEAFPSPVIVTNPGDACPVLPQFAMGSQT